MSKAPRIKFALCWHMHQPWYQDSLDGEYRLPWVYLHAIKDYSDMAAHLEAHPRMKLTVNFAPVLLDQLDDYARQLADYLGRGLRMRDPMLNLLAGLDAVPADRAGRLRLLQDCQRANAEKMIDPYSAYLALLKPLRSLADGDESSFHDNFIGYLDDRYFIDLLVWYHLAWLGHALKQTAVAQRLIDKATGFDEDDRRELLALMHDCIAGLIPRYRTLAERGQVELSMTPYGHPIVPLLNNFDNMECAQAAAPRPARDAYPGGTERARWHMQQGLDCFIGHFGFRPAGVWFSEGAVSEDAIALADEFGFGWTASGESVWHNSMKLKPAAGKKEVGKSELFRAYRLDGYQAKMFFRDDGMSDLIGFEYSKRNSDEAAKELVQHLVNIADSLGKKASEHVVSVILDGENAWEFYPHNGHYFLDHLYAQLSGHERIEVVGFSDAVTDTCCGDLERLCAGSWVYGSFSTWIGEPDKNRAWELLVDAKHEFDRVMATNELDESQRARVTLQLAIAEGSDWFWWFGDYNPAGSVSDFDELFRLQLSNLYRMLGLEVPAEVGIPVSVGGGDAENAGTMVRNA